MATKQEMAEIDQLETGSNQQSLGKYLQLFFWFVVGWKRTIV